MEGQVLVLLQLATEGLLPESLPLLLDLGESRGVLLFELVDVQLALDALSLFFLFEDSFVFVLLLRSGLQLF